DSPSACSCSRISPPLGRETCATSTSAPMRLARSPTVSTTRCDAHGLETATRIRLMTEGISGARVGKVNKVLRRGLSLMRRLVRSSGRPNAKRRHRGADESRSRRGDMADDAFTERFRGQLPSTLHQYLAADQNIIFRIPEASRDV